MLVSARQFSDLRCEIDILRARVETLEQAWVHGGNPEKVEVIGPALNPSRKFHSKENQRRREACYRAEFLHSEAALAAASRKSARNIEVYDGYGAGI